MTTYEYPINGVRNETVAVLADGRRMTVCPQYGSVSPKGRHQPTCDQVTKMGGRCTCGMLAGVDVAGLLADAQINGKFGPEPVAVNRGPSAKCGSWTDADMDGDDSIY